MDKKKELQKVVGLIRKDWRVKRNTPNGAYPKAMMTSQQMEHNTATVNCGGGWCSFSKELSQFVMDDERFQKFLSDTGAEAFIEQVYDASCPGYQVRIYFGDLLVR